MQQHRIRTNGIEIYVETYGSTTAPQTLFLLHPGGTNLYIWHKMIPRLGEKYRLVAVDMRGHGQSETAAEGYAMNNQAKDLIGVMDALHIPNAHMIGNSLGTDVAVHLAALASERVRSLVNIDAGMLNFIGPGGEAEGTKEERVAQRLQRPIIEFNDRNEFAAFIQEHYSELGDDYVSRTAEHTPLRRLPNGKVTHAMPNEIGALLMAAWCDMKFEECYPSVRCPVLFLPAEQEAKLAEKLAAIEAYRSFLPSVEVEIVPGTSHIPLVSHAEAICDRISRFIEGISKS